MHLLPWKFSAVTRIAKDGSHMVDVDTVAPTGEAAIKKAFALDEADPGQAEAYPQSGNVVEVSLTMRRMTKW